MPSDKYSEALPGPGRRNATMAAFMAEDGIKVSDRRLTKNDDKLGAHAIERKAHGSAHWAVSSYQRGTRHGETKEDWKTNLLVALLILAISVAALITFLP